MKHRYILIVVLMGLIIAMPAYAVLIGNYPGLQKLIDSADAIVILRIDRHLSGFGSPSFYSTHECYIYQTIKGNIPKNTRINLQLMDTEAGGFATPYAHGSTHLMFLMKKAREDEPTEYRTLTFKGAHILLPPLGNEKSPEGKTIEQKIKNLIKGAIEYREKEHKKNIEFLETMLGQNGLLRASETQTSDGELGFSMTTTTKDGVTIHATAEPNTLTFLMEGNIEPNRWLPMLGLNIHYKELTQEQIEQKEVALQLLEYSGNFVDPGDVQLKTSSRKGTTRIRFMCVGEEDGSRRIELNAQLKDAKGNSLVTMNRICNCNFGGGKIQRGTLNLEILPGNSEHFDFDRHLVKDVKQISITLKEL